MLEVSGGTFVLTASRRRRATVASASFELDPALISVFQGGDSLSLARTGSIAGLGVSLVREDRLVFAVGAVSAVPLGGAASLKLGRDPELRSLDITTKSGWESFVKPRDNWIDLSVSGISARLRQGAEETVGGLRVSVLRSFEYHIPGIHECVAISREGECSHDPVLRSAKLLLDRENGGLTLNGWASESSPTTGEALNTRSIE